MCQFPNYCRHPFRKPCLWSLVCVGVKPEGEDITEIRVCEARVKRNLILVMLSLVGFMLHKN
jgi:hypothetical protein